MFRLSPTPPASGLHPLILMVSISGVWSGFALPAKKDMLVQGLAEVLLLQLLRARWRECWRCDFARARSLGTYSCAPAHARAPTAAPHPGDAQQLLQQQQQHTPSFARCCGALLLAAAASPPPPDVGVGSIAIRRADLQDPIDAEALCCVRKPTEYVSEAGSAGFMGMVVELEPEEAQRRRVRARLGTAMRDGAMVLIAVEAKGGGGGGGEGGGSADSSGGGEAAAGEQQPALVVLGTVDCIELPAGKGRRALGPELPRRLLVRNLWVSEELRRQGLARRLMAAAEELARGMGVSYLSLDVLADNAPALRLYESLGFEDVEPPPVPMPAWLRGSLTMGREVEGAAAAAAGPVAGE